MRSTAELIMNNDVVTDSYKNVLSNVDENTTDAGPLQGYISHYLDQKNGVVFSESKSDFYKRIKLAK